MMMRTGPAFLLTLALTACGGESTPSTTPTATPAETATKAPATGGASAVTLAWQATQAADENVDVVLLVAGERHALGPLAAASDDAPGTPATCSLTEKPTPTKVGFTCGMTPFYNFYTAELVGGEIVVTKTEGIDSDEPSEETKEVARFPVSGTTLIVEPYVAPPSAEPAADLAP